MRRTASLESIAYNACMALSSRTQRSLLLSFILSLSVCGLLGIYVLLVGKFGTLEARILGSTATIGAASILAMAAAIAWESRRWHPIGPIGAAIVAIALSLILLLIWDIRFVPVGFISRYEKFVATCAVFAVAVPHVALLALARLHRGFEWVRMGTVAVIFILAVLIACLIWLDPRDDLWPRMVGVFAILDACGTLAVPILHRVSRIHEREQFVTTVLDVTLTCPRCGVSQTRPTGLVSCACGLKIRVEIEEEHCPKCGYSLYKAASNACPECGTPIA